MRIMSVDYGDRRTGIAICDKNEMLASPIEVITEYSLQKSAERVAEIAKKEHAELIVVGLPRNMDGSMGDRAKKCVEYAELITQYSDIEHIMWDERQTTVIAHKYLNETNVRGKKRKAVVDEVAAVIILEDYLSYRKNKQKSDGTN